MARKAGKAVGEFLGEAVLEAVWAWCSRFSGVGLAALCSPEV